MRGTREEDREEFGNLINICESAITSLEKYWHSQMKPTLKGGEYKEIKFWSQDALVGLRSDIMSLERNLINLIELEEGRETHKS